MYFICVFLIPAGGGSSSDMYSMSEQDSAPLKAAKLKIQSILNGFLHK